MRMLGQNCRCDAPVYPDCFGCPVSLPSIPLTWQLDFPAAMEYASGVNSGSYTNTTTVTTSTFPPWQRTTITTLSGSYELPDLSLLGVPSVMDLDQNSLLSVSAPYTQCIWASNEFVLYETGYSQGVPWGNLAPCPTNGDTGAYFLGSEYTGATAWYYGAHANVTPPAFSYNRARTTISTADYRCDTYRNAGCFVVTSKWTCSIRAYGVFALLQVTSVASVFTFDLTIYWWPRFLKQNESVFYDYNTSTGVRTATKYNSSLKQYLNTFDVPNKPEALAAFPAASAVANLSQGPMVRYTKTVNCNTDFVGTPVTLTKAQEYYAYTGATQSKLDAVGIMNVPSTITITPV